MGLSGISFWELLLVALVLLVLFGSKKLPGIASDLGSAIRDFRRAVSGNDATAIDHTATAREAEAASDREPPRVG